MSEVTTTSARITEIRIGIARTINLGNYESLRLEGSLTAAIQDGDDIAAVKAAAQVELRAMLEETYRSQYQPKPQPRSEPVSRVGQSAPGGFESTEPEY